MKSWHITLSSILVLCLLVVPLIVACSKPVPAPAPPTPAAAPAPAPAPAKPIELKYYYWGGPQGYWQDTVLRPYIKDLEEKSGGRVKIQLYTSGTFGGSGEAYDVAAKGVADIAFVSLEANVGRFPMTAICELPFAYTSGKMGTKVLQDFYKLYLTKEYAETHPMILFTTSPRFIFTTKKPISSLGDLKGLRIRFSGTDSKKLLEALGTVPTNVDTKELYSSLERGLLDGISHCYMSISAFGIGDLLNYGTSVAMDSHVLVHAMNKKSWDNLPQDIKTIFTKVNEDWTLKTGIVYDEADVSLAKQWAKHGYKVVNVSPDEGERWKKLAMPLWDECVQRLEAKGLPAKQAMSEFERLLKKYAE